MRHHHENFSHTTPEYTNRTIKQLRTCELLLERLINDDYAQHLVPPYEPFGQRITDERAAEWKIYLKEERRARAADEAYLFNYMRKYYRHWWD
jgi:phosphatidylserine/phosphatidylglycerophosphate/cardiolipin synthase-like enzyme